MAKPMVSVQIVAKTLDVTPKSARRTVLGITTRTAIDLCSGCGGLSAGAATAISDLEVDQQLEMEANATVTSANAHLENVVDCCDV